MAISVQERRASQQAAQRPSQQHSRICHQPNRDPNLYDMETFGGQQNHYSSPTETWEPNPQSSSKNTNFNFRRAGQIREPSLGLGRICAPIKRRIHEHPTESAKSSFAAPMAKKARTPSQEPEASEYRPRHLSVDTLLQQPPTALSPPHHRYVQNITPQPAQHQVHYFVPSPSHSPAPSQLAASRAFPPPHHRPSMSPHMQGHICSSSPRSRLTSRDEGSSPMIPVVSAIVHVNHQSGEHANTGFNALYGNQSRRQANRSSIASSESNTGAGSLDCRPEERPRQYVPIDIQLQKLQSMTPELREEEFGKIDAVRLKTLSNMSPWCKDKIQKSGNASATLTAATIEREKSEPSGSGYACYYCWEMCGEDKFGKDQPLYSIKKPSGNYRPFNKKRKYPESTNIEELRRFCMDCGVRLHFYRRYWRFDSMAGPVWWACRCRVLRPAPVVDDGEPCPDCNCICPLRNPDEDDNTFESDESDESDA